MRISSSVYLNGFRIGKEQDWKPISILEYTYFGEAFVMSVVILFVGADVHLFERLFKKRKIESRISYVHG
jgi:hypothetical protein